MEIIWAFLKELFKKLPEYRLEWSLQRSANDQTFRNVVLGKVYEYINWIHYVEELNPNFSVVLSILLSKRDRWLTSKPTQTFCPHCRTTASYKTA